MLKKNTKILIFKLVLILKYLLIKTIFSKKNTNFLPILGTLDNELNYNSCKKLI